MTTATRPFDQHGERFQIQSPAIEVSPAAVLPISIVLNELCTNAVKYGALSTKAGRVAISASVDAPQQQFYLAWRETGGPTVATPKRRGFGSQLIDGVVNQLRGQASVSFERPGVACTITIPLPSLSA